MTAAAAFTLRPLERTAGNDSLDQTAFRVHLSTKELRNLGLTPGDLVRISTAKGFHGYALAWLAQQMNPGNKPIAKTTDLLRDKYGLTLTDSIFIEKAGDAYKPIESVRVRCTQSPEALSKYESTEELTHCVSNALENLDIFLPGCTFDVHLKGPKPRQKISKFRAIVEDVDPHPSESHSHYFDAIRSRLTVVHESLTKEASPKSDEALRVNEDGIGGLSHHFETINNKLARMTSPVLAFRDTHLSTPNSFLIHGPEKCGKTLLLERLAECPWRRVLRLNQRWLVSNRKAQAEALSTDVFATARANQPALILIDNLDKFLQKAENLVEDLELELKRLKGTQVVVAAAVRSVYEIDSTLQQTSVFRTKIEILPPNVRQREDIFRQIVGLNRKTPSVNFEALADRSHGFVAGDIQKLCELADEHREEQLSSLDTANGTSYAEMLETMDFITQENFDAVIDQVQPTVLKDSILEVPKIKWTDIAGVDHVRKQLEAIIVDPYKRSELYAKFPSAQSRKGILLYGPPGCAKTLIAQAVATESNQNFLAVKGSELIKMYVGESERGIRDIFRRARTAKPCVIFFDEIDSIGKSRERTQDSGLNVVTTLLNEMDGIERLKDVFIIAATNRPDILDSALIRPGRFDVHVHIGLPSTDARRQIFNIHTRELPLAGDVDLNILASRTEGSSGADIKGLCDVTAHMAISDYTPEGQAEVRMCHFERALDQHIPHTLKEEAERYEGWRPGISLSAA